MDEADNIIEEKKGEEPPEGKKEKNSIEENKLIKERKEKIINFVKQKYNWISYVVLAIIVWIAIRIRTRNLSGLRDVTTGGWTLGPDLDPFLFLRWAKYIVENGTLFSLDMMRNVPIGFNTKAELLLHPYMIAWFHNIVSYFKDISVEQSAALYPVFFFAITVIVFFFLVRKIFIDKLGERDANIIALVSSFFLTVLPPLLPRTIAGIPEKESAAFFFLFMSFYLFLSAWKSKHKYGKYILAILAGTSTAGMAFIWGGFNFIFVILSLSTFIAFVLGQVNKEKFYIYSIWIFSAFIIMPLFSSRYTITGLVSSVTTGFAFLVFLIMAIHLIIYGTKVKNYFKLNKLEKVPPQIISLSVTILITIIFASVFFGPTFIFDRADTITQVLVKPTVSRIGVTVAENRQPYFNEWSNSFGPIIIGIPIFFWLFFIGSIYLFFNMVKVLRKKERWILTSGYFVFLVAIIFSRFRSNHILNGENFTSLSLYFIGVIIFLGIMGFYYYKYHMEGLGDKFKSIDFGMIFIFVFFFFSIVSARGAVRLIMMLVPSASIIVSYFVVSISSKAKEIKDKGSKWVGWFIIAIIIISVIFSGYQFYKISNSTAQGYIPSVYNQQWQKAMSWVRDNTPENAVFGHWWDYGYWIQTIGQRATILDGGNAQSYWNHLMGRYALTGPDEMQALEFLYAHNTTHFLIDSTDIGKYTAFSSIGSDENYDRRSWIHIFLKDNTQTQETKNSITFFYRGGSVLDEDILYEENDSKIFLPGGGAGIGGILVERDNSGKLSGQPLGIYIYQQNQYNLPLRYAYDNGEFIDFGSGIEAGIFLMQKIDENAGQVQIDPNGALLYLSRRTVKSQLAKFYLYSEENEFFKIAHIESDFIINNLRSQGLNVEEFAYFRGFRGPIKIWEINYPEDMEFKEEFIDTAYPESLQIA
ncbi:MAG: hypothetical protein IIA87_02510 [Nanoarchaeota archaeon]|nr:hypothetical protein [Nanoarchaeota archaeon]